MRAVHQFPTVYNFRVKELNLFGCALFVRTTETNRSFLFTRLFRGSWWSTLGDFESDDILCLTGIAFGILLTVMEIGRDTLIVKLKRKLLNYTEGSPCMDVVTLLKLTSCVDTAARTIQRMNFGKSIIRNIMISLKQNMIRVKRFPIYMKKPVQSKIKFASYSFNDVWPHSYKILELLQVFSLDSNTEQQVSTKGWLHSIS